MYETLSEDEQCRLQKEWLSEPPSNEFIENVFSAMIGGITFPSAKHLANLLGLKNTNKFHKQVKSAIKKDFSKEMKRIKSTNPDIGLDDLGNIVLKNPKTGTTINTNVPFSAYKA